ncbi:MAG: FecCD family ABC transporter permease [Oscillospiraceae bacterium]|jgi:iron complex transport system permease protein
MNSLIKPRVSPLPLREQSIQCRYREEEMLLRKKQGVRITALFLLTIVGAIASLWVGYYPLPARQVLHAFLAGVGFQVEVMPQAMTIFWSIRLPRILAALMIGGALAVSGSVYQGMFRNPLVSPDILGVSSGAGMGAAIAIFGGFPYWYTQIFAFLGGIAAVSLSYFISTRSKHNQVLTLVLTGSMISALCNAVVTMIKYLSDPGDVLQQLTFWLMGSLTKVRMEGIALSAVPMAVGIVIVFAMRWRVNLLSLEDEEAISIGIPIRRDRLILIFASTLLSASAVCLGGLIGWVGLMIPHICRALFGPDHKWLMPACTLMGGLYLMLMDNLARSLLTMELPIGVVTAFIGAPFFVGLILRKKGG